jgi:tetratricopeptide (TPR) repeat protein/energy-coupling factor transporter ATP-binding protein EcfA2
VPGLPSPVLRALQGLAENSGRTLAIVGPPASGKSALLEELGRLLRARKGRVIELRGSYRGRSIPYGALDGLRAESVGIAGSTPSEEPAEEGSADDLGAIPVPTMPYLSDRLPRSRRSRAERPRTTFLGQPVRGRSANEGDPDAFWQELLPEFRGSTAHPVAILIDDAALFDTESRDFVAALSKRARFRPFLIALALDSSVPGFVAWEEAFLGRGDVDWIRFSKGLPDPREAHRLKAVYDDLPSISQRVAGYVSLLGGTVGEVVLSRVARLTFPQLAEALLPATGVGLVKVSDGKVSIPHQAWIPLTEDLIPEPQRQEMHLEIANALAALSPEPNLARRTEVARHYLAWYPGPMALRYLLEAAEISLQLLAYDSAEELLADAISCLGALPPHERDPLEPELRLLHARALFCAGRLTEAETEVRQGLDDALRAKVAPETIAEWVEPLLLTMRAVGPRPALTTTLLELVDRCHAAELVEVEVLFEALVAEFHYERNHPERARTESDRAALLARKLPSQHIQALALLAVGLSRIEGNPEEQQLAERFLRAARLLLARSRRWELDALAEDLEARLLETRGEPQRARELRERSLPALQRAKLAALEIYQQLGIAESLLNREHPRDFEPVLDRARQLTEQLHLMPPSVALLRCWLLEGRSYAIADQVEPARERWEAIVDEPAAGSIPRLKAEALVRLALLEYASGRNDRAAELVERIHEPELHAALPEGWRARLGDLARLAPESDLGGAPFPAASTLERRREPERRERGRREPVGDGHRAHDRQDDHEDPVQ